jgi:TonB-linked SusC/RagA family outer membrane protein
VRITGIILLAACLNVSARGTAQRLSIDVKNVSLEKVFADIEQQSNYVFTYDALLLAGTRPVTIELKEASIEDILRAALKNQLLDFSILNNTVFIKRKVKTEPNNLPAAIDGGTSPNIPEVTGNITDETGQPLAGATIKLKDGKVVGFSDEKGNFKLKNVSVNAVIEISFTGYGVTEVPVNSKSALKISLKRANNKLDDVQVIAYGTTTERLNTGDVTTVTAKEIEEQPVSNPLEALEGRVPGLVINQLTGAPGGGFTVQIRGQNSISNGNDPFYVIDGVPYPSQTLGLVNGTLGQDVNGNRYSGNPLNFINPADIESIEILKDADATSIYGSRAANGAILITTKKGKAGSMKVDANLYSGVGKVTREEKLLNTPQYLQMRREAFYNDSISLGDQTNISNAPDLLFWDTTRFTNWQKVLIGNPAHYDDAQVSVSGGTTNTQYLIGGGYHRETTVFPVILPGQGADQKVSLHFNMLNSSENKKLKLSLSGSYVSDLNSVQPVDFTGTAYTLPPDAPAIYNPDGSLNWAPVTPGQTGTWSNPFALLTRKYKGITSNLVGNALISYELLAGLHLKASMGYTNTQTDEVNTDPTTVFDPARNVTSGFSIFNSTNTNSWIIEPQADYRVSLGKGGVLSALAGSTLHENNTDVKTIQASGFISDALLEDIGSASSLSPTSSSAQYKYSAFFGRLNYNWQDKYLLNITARRDGSSRFGPGKQFADFGAIGTAWIFSEENFFKQSLSFISFGKIRASYGTSGNDQIGDYRFLDLYTTTSNPYQNIQGLYVSNLFNPDLAWELDKKLEGGMELGFLKDRIMINTSYFRNRSGNQLMTTPLSLVTGFPSITANLPALVQNSGIEMVLNTTNIRSKNFNWKSSVNLSIPRNKLVSFANLKSSPYTNTLIVGQPINIIKAYHLIGVNDTTGIYQFATAKGGPTYNPTYNVDNTKLINTTPRFYGGFLNSFQWKGFTLDFIFQFTKQTSPNIFQYYSPMPGAKDNQPAIVLNRWQKAGDVKPFQQFSQDYSSNAYNGLSYLEYSDFAYSDASFIRLKNLSFSYIIPASNLKRWHLQNLRVYIQGQNLLTFTKYIGMDPESQSIGLPPLKVWTGGIQIAL